MSENNKNLALSGRKILLGVTAGVAAYKSAILARLLVKAGARVRVVMTSSAQQFIGEATFQAITGESVRTGLFDSEHEAAMGHIELARWAELVLIAPATADFIAKLAHGGADDLLSTLCLATPAAVVTAPAMNQQMWRNAATAANVQVLEQRGIRLWGPVAGEQACGDVGPGRMMEPEDLLARVVALLSTGRLSGVSVLVTAGPTNEPLDPVRFIGNRSSGKMGFAVAVAFARAGADVIMVTGPVALPTPAGVERKDVSTALEMRDTVIDNIRATDLFISCAAVADYRPESVATQKIKKTDDQLDIRLVKNPDILAQVAALEEGPFTVGFAAESQDLADNAQQKRKLKKVDMIAANLITIPEQGFDADNNELLVLWEGGSKQLPRQAKSDLAEQLLGLIVKHFYAQTGTQSTGCTTG